VELHNPVFFIVPSGDFEESLISGSSGVRNVINAVVGHFTAGAFEVIMAFFERR